MSSGSPTRKRTSSMEPALSIPTKRRTSVARKRIAIRYVSVVVANVMNMRRSSAPESVVSAKVEVKNSGTMRISRQLFRLSSPSLLLATLQLSAIKLSATVVSLTTIKLATLAKPPIRTIGRRPITFS